MTDTREATMLDQEQLLNTLYDRRVDRAEWGRALVALIDARIAEARGQAVEPAKDGPCDLTSLALDALIAYGKSCIDGRCVCRFNADGSQRDECDVHAKMRARIAELESQVAESDGLLAAAKALAKDGRGGAAFLERVRGALDMDMMSDADEIVGEIKFLAGDRDAAIARAKHAEARLSDLERERDRLANRPDAAVAALLRARIADLERVLATEREVHKTELAAAEARAKQAEEQSEALKDRIARAGYEAGAMDMRERAAKVCDEISGYTGRRGG